jgi:hypothetical protein
VEGSRNPSGGVSARLRGRYGALVACFAALALAVPGIALALIGSGPTLTIEVQPPGSGRVVGPGVDCDDKCSYEIEETVTLTAIPNPGYIFKSWKGCDTVSGLHCTVTPLGQTIGAKFAKTQNLTVSKAEGSGLGKVSSLYGVSCMPGCTSATATFLYGAAITVKEAPSKHFHFVEWLGDCTGPGSCELLMNEDHEVEALFAEDPKHALTLTKNGEGQGSVKSKPPGVSCAFTCTAVEAEFYAGEIVVLEATPGKGSTFEGWSGSCSGTGTCAVTMSEAENVVAEFD